MIENTLGEEYGKGFESTLCYLLLFDDSFADTVSNAVKEELFNQAELKEIIRTFSTLKEVNPNSCPSYKSVRSYLLNKKKKLDASKSPNVEITNKALKKIRSFAKQEYPSQGDVDFIKDSLHAYVTHRSTEAALLGAVDLLENGQYDDIRTLIDEATQSGRMQIAPSLGLEFTDIDGRLASYQHRGTARVNASLGIPRLDSIMRGGLEDGRIGIFMAATGVGKTMAMVNAGAVALLQGLTVVHVTLEIDENDTAMRYDARILGYPINEIMKNISKYEPKMRKVANNLKSNLFIKYWGSDEASVMDVRAYLKVLEARKGVKPDLLILDYADLLKPHRNHREHRFELKDTMRALRRLAVEFDMAIWTGSQVNKEGFDAETLSLRTISEASEKANVADVIIGMCQTDTEKRRNRMRLRILKNRQGGKEKTTVDCLCNTGTQTITEAGIQGTAAQGGSNGTRKKRANKLSTR
jgi:replicative DNA helicase